MICSLCKQDLPEEIFTPKTRHYAYYTYKVVTEDGRTEYREKVYKHDAKGGRMRHSQCNPCRARRHKERRAAKAGKVSASSTAPTDTCSTSPIRAPARPGEVGSV